MLLAFNKPYGVLSQFTSDGSPNRPLAEFAFPKNVYPIGRLDADSEGLLLLSDEPELNQRLLHPRHAHEREYWAQVERIPTPEALGQLTQGITIQGHQTLPCRAWMLEPQPVVLGENPSSGFATLSPSDGERIPRNEPARVEPRNPERGRLAREFLHLYETRGRAARAPGRSMDQDGLRGTPHVPSRNPPIRFRKSVPDCWIGLELIEGKNRQVRRMTAAIGHPTLRLLRVRIGGLRLENLPVGQWKTLSPTERTMVLQ